MAAPVEAAPLAIQDVWRAPCFGKNGHPRQADKPDRRAGRPSRSSPARARSRDRISSAWQTSDRRRFPSEIAILLAAAGVPSLGRAVPPPGAAPPPTLTVEALAGLERQSGERRRHPVAAPGPADRDRSLPHAGDGQRRSAARGVRRARPARHRCGVSEVSCPLAVAGARAIDRSCRPEPSSKLAPAPSNASSMSHCASHTSP